MPRLAAVEDFGSDGTSSSDEEDNTMSDGAAGKAVDGPNGARPYRVAYFGGMDFQACTAVLPRGLKGTSVWGYPVVPSRDPIHDTDFGDGIV
eukprot:363069-Chlamydomonas_euryale.AAC.4